MLTIEWSEEYGVDGGAIDAEHKTLIAMANRLFAVANPSSELEEVIELVHQLFSYVDTHFQHEEEFMAEVGYPDLAGHMAKHRRISKRLAEVIRLQKNLFQINQYLQHLVLDWVLQHIQGEDKKIKVFLDQQRTCDMALANR